MRLLYITSLSGKRINGFMRSAIIAARKLNIDFTLACNMDMADKDRYMEDCAHYGISVKHIDFERNPISGKNKTAYRQLLAFMEAEKFDAVHCNTPIGGVLGRICAKKAKIPYVIYQAHGFHFWDGAPVKNWLIYYPVERMLARYTDQLITINREDHQRAQKFRLKKDGKLTLVHGVGVDAGKVEQVLCDPAEKRASLQIPADATVFVTAGELNDNKNHKTAINAFADANIPNSYFVICGDGDNREALKAQIEEKGLADRIILAGFRSDMFEILKASDVFVFSSFREGLPGALMEAMAAGLPCVASRIRGNVDLLGEDYPYLFKAEDFRDLSEKMKKVAQDSAQYGAYCRDQVKPYVLPAVVDELQHIYRGIPAPLE